MQTKITAKLHIFTIATASFRFFFVFLATKSRFYSLFCPKNTNFAAWKKLIEQYI